MTHHFCAVEPIGSRTPAAALTSSAWLDEAAPRPGKRAHRLAPGAPRGPSRARNARGYICFCVDSRGRRHFNFPQRVWPHPSVQMAIAPGKSIELETPAIDLL